MLTLMSVQGPKDGKSFELGNLKKGAAAGTEVARLPSHRVQPLEPAVLEERIGAEWGHLPPPPDSAHALRIVGRCAEYLLAIPGAEKRRGGRGGGASAWRLTTLALEPGFVFGRTGVLPSMLQCSGAHTSCTDYSQGPATVQADCHRFHRAIPLRAFTRRVRNVQCLEQAGGRSHTAGGDGSWRASQHGGHAVVAADWGWRRNGAHRRCSAVSGATSSA